jgi:hypothetical protein
MTTTMDREQAGLPSMSPAGCGVKRSRCTSPRQVRGQKMPGTYMILGRAITCRRKGRTSLTMWLTAANKEIFMAVGMGDMVMSILNGDKEAKMKLSRVLYTPVLGFTLIGRIDKAGYFSTFGGGKCEIQTGE